MTLITCQAVCCEQIIQGGRFMCRPHWMALPMPLRRQVNATWGKRQAAAREGKGVRAMAAEIIDHTKACDEARRWTAEGEGHLDRYRPDAERLTRLYAAVLEEGDAASDQATPAVDPR